MISSVNNPSVMIILFRLHNVVSYFKEIDRKTSRAEDRKDTLKYVDGQKFFFFFFECSEQ